jgi:FkbM family methyltransferase
MKKEIKKITQKIIEKCGYSIYSKVVPTVIENDVVKYYINQAHRISNKKYEIKTIFDVGANIGQTALNFKKSFPQSEIYCFEPIKDTFSKLVTNTKTIGNIHPHNCAFGSNQEKFKIYLKPQDTWNSIVTNETWGVDPNKFEYINIETVDDFIKQNQIHTIDILKTDTEGFDLEVLKGAKNLLLNNKIQFVISEVGFIKEDLQHSYFENICSYLNEYGFRLLGFFGGSEDLVHYYIDKKLCLGYCNCIFYNTNFLK